MVEKKKILQIGCENFGVGGRSVIIYNLTRNLCDEYRFDFLSCGKIKNKKYKKLIEESGGKILIYLENKNDNKLIRELKRTYHLYQMIKKENYDLVHINADDAWEAAKSQWIARRAGVKEIIVHAHTTGTEKKINCVKRAILNVAKLYVNGNADEKLACSVEAAQYLFGKKHALSTKIIKNGIDIQKFQFSGEKRKIMRKELGIKENYHAICSVGRLSLAKNPIFLLEVIHEVYKMDNNILFFLVGEGQLRDKIEDKIKKLNMEDYVFLLGNRNDVNEILQAMDLFILASKYEGFGIVNIEAQAIGLPGIVSDAIPKEAIINNNFYRISLEKGPKFWATYIENQLGNWTKEDVTKKITDSGYDIRKSSRILGKIYEELLL